MVVMVVVGAGLESGGDGQWGVMDGGISQGVESSWEDMISSIEASPPGCFLSVPTRLMCRMEEGKGHRHGASEQYMCRARPSRHAKGWPCHGLSELGCS